MLKNYKILQPTRISSVLFLFLINFLPNSSSSTADQKLDDPSGGLECDHFVRIESRDPYGYLANVSFLAPVTANTSRWTLNMTTDVPYTFISCWHVIVFMEDGPNGLARFHNKDSRTVKAGDAISFRFRVMYAPGKQVPKCKRLVWEDHVICPMVAFEEPKSKSENDTKIIHHAQQIITNQNATVPLWLFFLLAGLLVLSMTCHLLILCRQRIQQDCLSKLNWPTNSETDTVELCEAQAEENELPGNLTDAQYGSSM